MSYLVTTATAVATAVTTTALVLPLLSCSPSSAYQKLLQWKGSSEKALSCTTSVVILKTSLSAGCEEDSAAEADTSMMKDNEVFMDLSRMADLFVAF
ncbi:hypothetical protein IV203_019911 [Nitzschia inconspicua]|uniref:Uncharacterized protein n=1 Tax=Nitzschia inconspicua TaxID=303405 RepID=A0A9K3M3F3_9STRA|nr:hypothetical protein IV203_019911 [Nitzschia inconspicua]